MTELISPEQLKAARALLSWKHIDLAKHSGVSVATLQRMEERGMGRSTVDTATLVQRTLEAAGIRFVSGGAILSGEQERDRDDALRAACLTTWKGA